MFIKDQDNFAFLKINLKKLIINSPKFVTRENIGKIDFEYGQVMNYAFRQTFALIMKSPIKDNNTNTIKVNYPLHS